MRESEYLFVDGGYLRKVLEWYSQKHFGGEVFQPNLDGFFREFRKTFYYDCLPVKKPKETKEDYDKRLTPMQEHFEHLRNQPGVHVIEGVLRGEPTRQKRIDVAIAVHMLTHSFRRNMTRATLLAGDQDFLFLVEALVLDGLYLTLWFEERASRELVMAADAQRKITFDDIWNFLPPNVRKLYPKPREGKPSECYPLRKGVDSFGKPVALCKEGDDFFFVRNYSIPSERHGLTSSNRDLLIAFAEYRYRGVEWDK